LIEEEWKISEIPKKSKTLIKGLKILIMKNGGRKILTHFSSMIL